MLHWQLHPLRLTLRYTWAISRNSSDYKLNYLVELSDGEYKGLGEAAPNIRYGETQDVMEKAFQHFESAARGLSWSNCNDFSLFLDTIKLPHALRFALESAYLHLLVAQTGSSVPALLHIPAPTAVATAYSIPIMEPGKIEEFFLNNNLARFKTLKIKINRDSGLDAIKCLSNLYEKPLMIDPNEAFSHADELLQFMEKLKAFQVAFLEQPMPASCADDYRYVRPLSPFLLMADESVTDLADMEEIKKQFHGVNMKLMKAGGYLKGLEILNNARQAGLKTMVGCMVESSLGISSAFHLCHGADFIDLDGFMIVEEEPFKLLHESAGMLYLNQ